MKKNNHIIPQNSFTEFLLYTAPDGKVKIEIFLRNENIWLTQAKIAEFFNVDRSVITKHLKNIFGSGELQETSVCAKFAHTADDGKIYRIVTMYLDYAEMQAQKGIAMYMKDWAEKLNAFLQFNEKVILQNNGKISHVVSTALAEKEYEKFQVIQDRLLESDFDRDVNKLLKSANKKEKYN